MRIEEVNYSYKKASLSVEEKENSNSTFKILNPNALDSRITDTTKKLLTQFTCCVECGVN